MVPMDLGKVGIQDREKWNSLWNTDVSWRYTGIVEVTETMTL